MQSTYGPGDRPLPGYTIRRGLGQGGFGEVYQAVSEGGKDVALKLVQKYLDVELRGVGQCLNLKHPNLVAIYDIRKAENDVHWIIMELVTGEGLDQVIARHPRGIPEHQLLALMRGICDGVAYLHDNGLVHRDLKPRNLFVEDGTVKIGDYGLSKFISASRRSGQTESVGTVHYMAPEVSLGRYGKEVDQYAIGVMLYEMLTGRVPFDGESVGEILMKHLTSQPDLRPLARTYQAVVARLLDKDPSRRYPSVRSVPDELPALGSVRPSVILRSAGVVAEAERELRVDRGADEAARERRQETVTHLAQNRSGDAGTGPNEPAREQTAGGARGATGFETARVVKMLIDNGIEAVDDISKVLSSLRAAPKQGVDDLIDAVQCMVENGWAEGDDIARVIGAFDGRSTADFPMLVAAVRCMVENGWAEGDEVANVVRAVPESTSTDLQSIADLVTCMVENGLESSDVTQVLNALKEYPGPAVSASARNVRDMVDNGERAEDIARALQARAVNAV